MELRNKQKIGIEVFDKDKIPVKEEGILGKRIMSSNENTNKSGERVMDDMETTIMGILDADGKINAKGRLTDFMALMTRIKKVDHRALSLHILGNCLADGCKHIFIEEGGLRILKQWIKLAQEQNCIKELKVILKLLIKLPFYLDHIKNSEIAGVFKQLQAWNDNAVKKEVLNLKAAWKNAEQTNVNGSNIRNNPHDSTPLTEDQRLMTSSIRDKITLERGEQHKAATDTTTTTTTTTTSDSEQQRIPSPSKLPSGSNSNSNSTFEDSANTNVKKTPVALNMVKVATESVTINGKDGKDEDEAKVLRARSLGGLLTVKKAPSTSTSSPTSASAAPTTASVQVSEVKTPIEGVTSKQAAITSTATATKTKKVIDMGAIARRKQEQDAEQALKDEAADALKAKLNAPKPGKGGLNKRTRTEMNGNGNGNNNNDGPPLKVVKRGVKWSDSEGSSLRQVHSMDLWATIDYGLNNLKSSKNKDMKKQEAQQERDARKLATQDTMHRTCEWKIPKKLKLSIEVMEASAVTVDSKEKALIDSRLAITGEETYPDVTLIPADPDEPNDLESDKVEVEPTKVVDIKFNSGPVQSNSNVTISANAASALASASSGFHFEPLGAGAVAAPAPPAPPLPPSTGRVSRFSGNSAPPPPPPMLNRPPVISMLPKR